MLTIDRQKVINELIKDDIDIISQLLFTHDEQYLSDILYTGHKGYVLYTEEELISEYLERFDEEIKIN